MGEFKHGQEQESSDVDRNERVQTWAGTGEFRCGQEWESSNMDRKRRVQMWTGMGEFKHGQELRMIYTPFRKLVNKIPVTKQIK